MGSSRWAAWRRVSLVCSLVALAQMAAGAAAQSSPEARVPERRILMLRADDTPRSSAETRIDRALGQALGELGFLVNVSPMPFHDAQLALGCPGSVRNCGGSVASALESEQLGVSAVDGVDAERAQLHLYLFAPGVEREGAAEIPIASTSALSGAVRELVRQVFGEVAPEPRVAARRARAPRKPVVVPEPAQVAASVEPAPTLAPAAPEYDSQPLGSRALRVAGWSTAAVGGALLVSGFATGIASRNASDAYADRAIVTRSDADRALESYARAERQADASRWLVASGSVVMVSGAAMLLWEYLAPRGQDRTLHIAAVPTFRGAALSLGGSFEGRSR